MLVISFTLIGLAAFALTVITFASIVFLITIIELETLLDLLVIETTDSKSA